MEKWNRWKGPVAGAMLALIPIQCTNPSLGALQDRLSELEAKHKKLDQFYTEQLAGDIVRRLRQPRGNLGTPDQTAGHLLLRGSMKHHNAMRKLLKKRFDEYFKKHAEILEKNKDTRERDVIALELVLAQIERINALYVHVLSWDDHNQWLMQETAKLAARLRESRPKDWDRLGAEWTATLDASWAAHVKQKSAPKSP